MTATSAVPPVAASGPYRGLADDLALTLDPARICQRLGFVPDEWQSDYLRSPQRRILLNTSRQAGKSTIVAAGVVWGSLFEPGLTIVLSPSERQSREIFIKTMQFWKVLALPIQTDTENTLELSLRNGSRIVALPDSEGKIRGFSGVKRLVIDEASRVSDDLFHAVTPMVAVSGGTIVALSTPFGKRGWWWDAYTSGGVSWQRFEIPATRCPRIPASFLEEQRRVLGPQFFAQEFMCQFIDLTTSYFSHDAIDKAIDPTLRPAF